MKSDSDASVRTYWRGLGLWNVYFLAKLILYWTGHANFHAFYNLVFASILLLPLPPLRLHRLRHALAVPIGIALLYYDSWLPPFRRLLEQPEVLQFSAPYLLELVNRFINWNMVGAGILLLVACLFLSQWVRVTVLSVSALVICAVPDEFGGRQLLQNLHVEYSTGIDVQAKTTLAGGAIEGPLQAEPEKSITETLTAALDGFHETEAARTTAFNVPANAPDFDIIFLSICSLSWSDLASAQLDQHPLIKSMDVVFDQFNGATAYSGPAIRRLLRAGCGQPSHSALYDSSPSHCYLFENLRQLGFQNEALLNHNGKFQDFIGDLSIHPSLNAPIVPEGPSPRWTAFDGSPVWGDLQTLEYWWQSRPKAMPATAVLYNSVTLHDGNREATADGGGRSAPYASRGKVVLDDLYHFIKQLESSGRRAIVVLVPEHGAALEGDVMQISGMREIPTPNITHIPVGVKLIGHPTKTEPGGRRISGETSYLALAELLSRLVQRPAFAEEPVNWDALTADLPLTRPVSENSGTVLMTHNGLPYVRLGQRDWIQYRQ